MAIDLGGDAHGESHANCEWEGGNVQQVFGHGAKAHKHSIAGKIVAEQMAQLFTAGMTDGTEVGGELGQQTEEETGDENLQCPAAADEPV